MGMRDGHRAGAGLASATFTVFVAPITLGRWYGTHLVSRYGPVTALRSSGALAVTGLLLLNDGHSTALAFASAAAWGLGTALGFPLGVSAAGRDPLHAAARVSVVSTLGYTAFLAGPPLLGLVGQHTGAQHALSVTAAVIAAGTIGSGVVSSHNSADMPEPNP
ncbi:MFS transporter [Motilibacter rhizosphaerae]|uniref:hypothetical protein n=1 Tax=Motilibacter rhizosphaerae TaxID=598652 RepID=UPI00102C3535|nr:hypothetical protein [Motilibacter rhizosphaerae]